LQQNKSLEELLNGIYADEARRLLKPDGQYESFEEVFRLQKEKEAQGILQDKLSKRVEELLKK